MNPDFKEEEDAEDDATVSDDLPEPTDPAQVPPDEGDVGHADVVEEDE